MARHRFFRDPIHGQIRFKRTKLAADHCPKDVQEAVSWLIPSLINTSAFQRLRHTRQNGLSSYVFYGLEHSRFTHSIGVYHIANEMYQAVVRNTEGQATFSEKTYVGTVVSALLHDIGHGPFSHTLEEAIRDAGKTFDHEDMTVRFVLEDAEIRKVLVTYDPELPDLVATYIKKSMRTDDHWSYRIVSSQFDADRIDYMMRDSQLAGFKGQGFDLPRLLDLIFAWNNRVVIDRHATEALESYLLTLMHLYIAIYYHRGVRGATVLLLSVLRRAFDLYRSGKKGIIPTDHPLVRLLNNGQAIDLDAYGRLLEFQMWTLISGWCQSNDPILADLSIRLISRKTFRASDIDYHEQRDTAELLAKIPQLIADVLHVSVKDAGRYYFNEDKPDREGYSTYNWLSAEGNDRSIWLGSPDEAPTPIENETKNEIFQGLRRKRIFPRLVYPIEVQGKVVAMLKR